MKTDSCVGSGCVYSLRCLKSARSALNMSVIPSAERDSFRSTSASAVNLNTIIMLHSHLLGDFKSRLHVWVLLRDEQADFSHVHQFGPALHRGCADVRDDVGQGGVLLRRQGNQHADSVAVIGQLDHLIFQTLGCGGHAWVSTRRPRLMVSRVTVTEKTESESSVHMEMIHLSSSSSRFIFLVTTTAMFLQHCLNMHELHNTRKKYLMRRQGAELWLL